MQGCVALLQFAPIRLKALKPKETDFEPQTIGDHIRKRRLLLKLTKKAVAGILKVSQFSIISSAQRANRSHSAFRQIDHYPVGPELGIEQCRIGD